MIRRDFIKKATVMGGLAPLIRPVSIFSQKTPPAELDFNIFSKHLQFLNYSDMAKAAADIGFKGVELTVRPGGHVEPENVEGDLPLAIEAIKKAGLQHRTMTTAVDNAQDPVDRKVLQIAANLGIEFYRMNWLSYDSQKTIPESIKSFQSTIRELGELNAELGIVGCYQNHAGTRAGASLWELHQMLATANPESMGAQYDIRHATVEGGLSWVNGLRLIQPRIETIVLKDFKWVESNGEWKVQDTPIGEGMVDFVSYFKMLKEFNLQVPITVHYEHSLGGAERGRSELTIPHNKVFKAMEKDIETLNTLWKSA
ncbi:MAG: sugar phosphate isomerase/epimerase family protein [Balneolales bacterium]